jgi:hypothetical protein
MQHSDEASLPVASSITSPAQSAPYALLAVAGLALVVRRRWPLAMFATTVAVSLVYYAAGYPDGPGTVGLSPSTP